MSGLKNGDYAILFDYNLMDWLLTYLKLFELFQQ